jgi:hypothetical protein
MGGLRLRRATGDIIWKFDSNNKNTIYPRTRNELIATPVIVDNKLYIANGQDPEHGEGPGTSGASTSPRRATSAGAGRRQGRERAGNDELLIPAGGARKGKPNPNSGVVWDFEKVDANKDGKIKGDERCTARSAPCRSTTGLSSRRTSAGSSTASTPRPASN